LDTAVRTERIERPRLRVIGGVCAGVAEHLDVPVTVIRVAAVVLSFTGGAGVLLYAWLWATTPVVADPREKPLKAVLTPAAAGNNRGADSTVTASAAVQQAGRVAGSAPIPPGPIPPGPIPPASIPPRSIPLGDGGAADGVRSAGEAGQSKPRSGWESTRSALVDSRARTAPITEILLGLVLIVAGGALVLSRLGVDVPLDVIIPGIVLVAGVALAWRQFADLRAGASTSSSAVVVRTLGALVLVAIGILLFFVTGSQPNVWTVVTAAIAVLVGVGLVALPWLIRLVRDLGAERSAREREAQRAEIAAHLHDSVLQTLALIQQKAGAQSEAARLARAQEQDLRAWLFDGTSTDDVDLAGELRSIAAQLERDHAVRFEIVTIGESTPAPEGLLAAGREAMLNAARHAGGDVSVYLEVGSERVELIVGDRGPGIELAGIPEDRFGVRESILGRMSRIGGTASIGAGRGGAGTDVVLRLPRSVDGQKQQDAGFRADAGKQTVRMASESNTISSGPESPVSESPDLGSPDLGSPDLGSPDLGSPDLGSPARPTTTAADSMRPRSRETGAS
jgi:signal transduction histidine kinase/phage shock protein PspC (stress-responsive transcriptional regulator)